MTQTPSLKEIRQRMNADLDYRLPAAQARPAKSVLGVLTTVISGAMSSLYEFGQWMMQQLDPMTCSTHWLSIWAERLQVPRKAATLATGEVVFIGGAQGIPAGTRLRDPESGTMIVTDHDGVSGERIAATAATAGYQGNLSNDVSLLLESPIAGVQMGVSIVLEFTGGADEESINAWRLRVTERLAERQKVGDADDYERWAKAAHPHIVDARAFGNYPALGVITIRVLGQAKKPILSDQVLAEAQARVDRTKNQGCTVILAPVLSEVVNIRIADVEQDTQPAIAAEIDALLMSRTQFGGQLWPEEIERIVLLYTDQFTLLSPVAKITASEHQILRLGSLQWL